MLLISSTDAVELGARLLGVSLLVQTLELLVIRRCLSEQGIWRMNSLLPELAHLPAVLRAVCLVLFPYRRFLALLCVQLGLAALLIGFGATCALPPATAIALLVSIRFRGTFNGGSDAMTVLTCLSLSVSACFPDRSLVQAGCLSYLALQTCLSYFVAGCAKLKQRSWRRGTALHDFAGLARYAVPGPALAQLRKPWLSRGLSLCVLALECSFPLALLGPSWCLAYLSIAMSFHISNAALFGLNRFLLAWLAAYPALYYVSQLGPLAGR